MRKAFEICLACFTGDLRGTGERMVAICAALWYEDSKMWGKVVSVGQ